MTGKIGTDIQEGKCSWLAVNALKQCNETQRALFVECYADKEPANVNRIKSLYNELRLPELYKNEERIIYEGILQSVNALPASDASLFLKLLDMLYKRKQ